MKPVWLNSILLLLALNTVVGAQNRPLMTETVETVEKGKGRFEFGFDFEQDVVYNLSGLEGDLTRLGVLGLRTGVGERVELQLFWTAQEFLNVNRRFDAPNTPNLDFSGNSTSDIGNVMVGTKVQLVPEKGKRPGLGFRFSVELPNTSSESGLGTDETQFYNSVLVQKGWEKLRLFGEVGLAILGDPVSGGAQDDLLIYGAAVAYSVSPKLDVVANLHGLAGSGGIGTEEETLLKLGVQVKAAGLYWDGSALFGFQDSDPSTGISFGITKEFPLPQFD